MQDRSSATQNVTRCPHVTQLGSQNPTFADLETQEGQMSVVTFHEIVPSVISVKTTRLHCIQNVRCAAERVTLLWHSMDCVVAESLSYYNVRPLI